MSNVFTLSNKTVLVTGASSGIGRQIAITLSEQHAKLIINGRDEKRLEETLTLLSGDGHRAIIADLNITDERESLYQQIEKIDGIVLASGILKTLPFKFITEDSLREVMNSNFHSPILLLSSIVKGKKINKGGSIVFISSIGGNIVGTVGNAMYCASKGAINSIQKVLALELAKQQIRVNNISPGMIRTNFFNDGSITSEQFALDEKKYPLGYGEPIDVANATIFLISDSSKWMTGSTLVLDGGFSLH